MFICIYDETEDLPALTFYNPLLNNPSSSEYIASVRSSLRSIDQIPSAPQLSLSPRLCDDRSADSVVSSVPPSLYWNSRQGAMKKGDSEKKKPLFTSNFHSTCCLHKPGGGFCIAVVVLLFIGIVISLAIYFTGNLIRTGNTVT